MLVTKFHNSSHQRTRSYRLAEQILINHAGLNFHTYNIFIITFKIWMQDKYI
jgi:hypothetical protein